MEITSDKLRHDFCAALDSEIGCHNNHAAASTRPPGCEACPFAMWLDIKQQLMLSPGKNMYDMVRAAVRRAIPEAREREILYGILREKIESAEE